MRGRGDGGFEGAIGGLEEEFSADLSLVAGFMRQSGADLPQALVDPRDDGVRDGFVLQVRGPRAHAQGPDHAELLVQTLRGVRVDREGAAGFPRVCFDELVRAAAYDCYEGAYW